MRSTRTSRGLVRISAIVGVGYVFAFGVLWLFQERLLFAGRRASRGDELPLVAGVRRETMTLADGTRIRVAIAEPVDAARGVMVFFGGNGEDLRSGQRWAKFWASDYALRTVYAEHPGYGESEGEPSVDSFALAAEAAVQLARGLAGSLPVFAGGNSLGGYCAMHVASRGLVDRVILRSSPSSIADVGGFHFPWMPVRLLLRHPFDSVALASAVRVPVLILHGDLDLTVPIAHGRLLAAALGSHAQFVEATGHDHNDVPLTRLGPFGATIVEFLGTESPR